MVKHIGILTRDKNYFFFTISDYRHYNHVLDGIYFWYTLYSCTFYRLRTTGVVIVILVLRQRRRRLFFLSWF